MKSHIKAKLFFIILNTLIINNNFALEVETSKVFDGTLARCENANDLYRNKAGVYRLKALSASINESSLLEIPLQLEFLNCSLLNGKYQLVESLPYADYEYTFMQNHVQNTVEEVRIKAYRDGIYDLLLDEVISNNSTSSLRFDADMETLITNEEKIELNDNGSVIIAVDFFTTKKIRTLTDRGNKFLRNISYGSFRVHIKIEKSEDSFKASFL